MEELGLEPGRQNLAEGSPGGVQGGPAGLFEWAWIFWSVT